MEKLQTLEELRTRKEVKEYFKQLGKEITYEELDALKQSYDQAGENNEALTMQQLDDVAGGAVWIIDRSKPKKIQELPITNLYLSSWLEKSENPDLKKSVFEPTHKGGSVREEATLKEGSVREEPTLLDSYTHDKGENVVVFEDMGEVKNVLYEGKILLVNDVMKLSHTLGGGRLATFVPVLTENRCNFETDGLRNVDGTIDMNKAQEFFHEHKLIGYFFQRIVDPITFNGDMIYIIDKQDGTSCKGSVILSSHESVEMIKHQIAKSEGPFYIVFDDYKKSGEYGRNKKVYSKCDDVPSQSTDQRPYNTSASPWHFVPSRMYQSSTPREDKKPRDVPSQPTDQPYNPFVDMAIKNATSPYDYRG